MADFGMKVSRPGYDVNTAADTNLVMSSGFNTFSIYRVIYFSAAGSEAHGLDYPPAYTFVKEVDSGEWQVGDGTYPTWVANVSVDDTNVYADTKCYVILFTNPLDE